jgi:hypothetical protein
MGGIMGGIIGGIIGGTHIHTHYPTHTLTLPHTHKHTHTQWTQIVHTDIMLGGGRILTLPFSLSTQCCLL